MAFPLTLRRDPAAERGTGGEPTGQPDTQPRGNAAPAWASSAGRNVTASDDFQQRLLAVVEEQMGRLTSADALDEWHRDYLDPRIDGEVEAQQRRIDLAVDLQRRSLQAQHSTLAARAESIEASLADAAHAAESAGQDLARRVAEAGELAGTPMATSSPAQAEALLAELAALGTSPHRSGWRPTRRRSESDLRRALAVLTRRQEERADRVARQRQAVAEAVARRQGAHEAYGRAGGAGPTPRPAP